MLFQLFFQREYKIDQKLIWLRQTKEIHVYVDTLIMCCICEANIPASSKKYIDREIESLTTSSLDIKNFTEITTLN